MTTNNSGGQAPTPDHRSNEASSIDTTLSAATRDKHKDIAEANALRDDGIRRATEAQEASAVMGPATWSATIDAAIEFMAAQHAPFTADDLYDVTGIEPQGRAMGGRFASAANRGIIVQVGWERSSRVKLHRSPLAKWIGQRRSVPNDAHSTGSDPQPLAELINALPVGQAGAA